jgi:uncharacterized protein (DUF2384 family)
MQNQETLDNLLFELFKDDDKIHRWLNQPEIAFNGQTPQALINNGELEPVIDLLGRMAHGVFT